MSAVSRHKTLSWPKIVCLNICNTIFQVFDKTSEAYANCRTGVANWSLWQEGIKNLGLIDLAYGTSTSTRTNTHTHTHTHTCTRTHTRPGTRPRPGQGSALITTELWLRVPAHISLSWPGKLFDYASKVKRLVNISVPSIARTDVDSESGSNGDGFGNCCRQNSNITANEIS